MVETDSGRTWRRCRSAGRRNEPAFVAHVAGAVARIRGEPLEKGRRRTHGRTRPCASSGCRRRTGRDERIPAGRRRRGSGCCPIMWPTRSRRGRWWSARLRSSRSWWRMHWTRGARAVTVSIERGGKGRIRVADDGIGDGAGGCSRLPRPSRHQQDPPPRGPVATSARSDSAGEALPSIAAVSRTGDRDSRRGRGDGVSRLRAHGRADPCGSTRSGAPPRHHGGRQEPVSQRSRSGRAS